MFEQELDRYLQRTTITLPADVVDRLDKLFPFSTKAGVADKMIWLAIEEICKANLIPLRDWCLAHENNKENGRRTFTIRPEKMGITKEIVRQIFQKRPDLLAIAPARLYRVLFFWGFDETIIKIEKTKDTEKTGKNSAASA